jgi:hypothetical protein
MLSERRRQLMTEQSKTLDEKEARLERARVSLLKALELLRADKTLSPKEADAVEAAIEDELIAMRVTRL